MPKSTYIGLCLGQIPRFDYCTVIKARDVAEVFGSQPLTLGAAVTGCGNFTVWVVTRRWGYYYEIP